MIRVVELSVRVPGFGIDRASFVVPDGGVGIVTGPTGAGKTTLIEAIAGVRAAAGGRVLLGGGGVMMTYIAVAHLIPKFMSGRRETALAVAGFVCFLLTELVHHHHV